MGVSIVKTPAGEFQLGGEIEGVFVSFVTLSEGRVAQLVQRGQILAERAAEGDERARDQVGSEVVASPRSRGKKGEPGEGGE